MLAPVFGLKVALGLPATVSGCGARQAVASAGRAPLYGVPRSSPARSVLAFATAFRSAVSVS